MTQDIQELDRSSLEVLYEASKNYYFWRENIGMHIPNSAEAADIRSKMFTALLDTARVLDKGIYKQVG